MHDIASNLSFLYIDINRISCNLHLRNCIGIVNYSFHKHNAMLSHRARQRIRSTVE